MKIAYFLDIPWGIGGAGNLLLQQAELMSKIHDVVVVIPSESNGNYNKEYANRCKSKELRFVCLRYNTAFNFKMIDFIGAMTNVDAIERFAEEESIDFFHSVQLNLTVEYVSRKIKVPHLMNIYQLKPEEYRICLWDVYSHYHLCDSLLYSQMWSQHLQIESKCIRPVAPLDDIKEKQISPPHTIRLLMLGVVCERKAQLVAIRAVARLAKKAVKVELHIAGEEDKKYAQKCKLCVEEHKLEQVVCFHGFVSDVSPLLERCDCLLCASNDESFPSSIVEAVTYGLTIISTPVAGVPEVFTDKENAFISKGFSESEISESIAECIEYFKNGRISDIQNSAKKTWKENFERKVIREKIDTYYEQISHNLCYKQNLSFSEAEREVKITQELLQGLNAEYRELIDSSIMYYTVIRKSISVGDLYIWGAGRFGKFAYEVLGRICPNVEIVAFIDSTKRGYYFGKPIISAENAVKGNGIYYSVSFVENSMEAVQYLQQYDLEINREIWMIP